MKPNSGELAIFSSSAGQARTAVDHIGDVVGRRHGVCNDVVVGGDDFGRFGQLHFGKLHLRFDAAGKVELELFRQGLFGSEGDQQIVAVAVLDSRLNDGRDGRVADIDALAHHFDRVLGLDALVDVFFAGVGRGGIIVRPLDADLGNAPYPEQPDVRGIDALAPGKDQAPVAVANIGVEDNPFRQIV
jgi:hypothetical protein